MHETFTLRTESTIRPCAEHDLPKLEWFGLFTPHREIIRDAFERQRRDENLAIVADLNGFPVAQVWVDLMRPQRHDIGLLWALRVIPCLQRLGIGTRMLDAAERALADRGYREAEIGVEKNSRAGALYRRIGYRCIGDRYEQYSYQTPEGDQVQVPVDQWIFRKRVHA